MNTTWTAMYTNPRNTKGTRCLQCNIRTYNHEKMANDTDTMDTVFEQRYCKFVEGTFRLAQPRRGYHSIGVNSRPNVIEKTAWMWSITLQHATLHMDTTTTKLMKTCDEMLIPVLKIPASIPSTGIPWLHVDYAPTENPASLTWLPSLEAQRHSATTGWSNWLQVGQLVQVIAAKENVRHERSFD